MPRYWGNRVLPEKKWESRFKKLRFKKESQFKKESWFKKDLSSGTVGIEIPLLIYVYKMQLVTPKCKQLSLSKNSSNSGKQLWLPETALTPGNSSNSGKQLGLPEQAQATWAAATATATATTTWLPGIKGSKIFPQYLRISTAMVLRTSVLYTSHTRTSYHN